MICLLRVGFDDTDEPDAAAPVTERFGNYRIEHRDDGTPWELGRGAMGITYRAIDTSLQRPVALKLIDSEWVKRGAEARERFMREARVAAALRHPNVAAVHHFGIREENGQCFCAMELVEGETLEMRVRRTGPLDALSGVEIALQVSSALAAAEKQGLVHRDLKPANLMLVGAPDANDSNATGAEELAVKVIDFGVAKALAEKPDAMGLTHGGFVGTPAFASPEQFTNASVDVRSDIYSLGATLWYLLTGQMPFPGASVEEIRASQRVHALPLEQLKAARVPNRFISLLVSMLALEPAARPGIRGLREKLLSLRTHLTGRRRRMRRLAIAAAFVSLGACVSSLLLHSVGNRRSQQKVAGSNSMMKSIAVLPFENVGEDAANAYFANGLQDDILVHLSKISELKVISRASVEAYRTRPRDVREIGKALGVATVLEGGVRRAGSRARINVQLINIATGAQIWAENYDRQTADILVVQNEIAQNVANHLQLVLSPTEKASLEQKPTQDPVAYELYLQAKQIERSQNGAPSEIFKHQRTLLEQAVARDPTFVPALCLLARNHLRIYWYKIDRSSTRLASAKKALETAAHLQPDAGEVHLTRALFYYWGNSDYEPALAELALARRALPNDVDVLAFIAKIEGRQGRWEESTRHFEEVIALDPRNTTHLFELAIENYTALRRYEDAARIYDGILAWKPNDFVFEIWRAEVDIAARADLRRMQSVLSGPSVKNGDAAYVAEMRLRLALYQRDYPAAKEALAACPSDQLNIDVSREIYEGEIAHGLGDSEKAQIAFLAAHKLAAAKVAEDPENAGALLMLAGIEARLGRKDDAIRNGERAAELLPVSKDAQDGPPILNMLAGIYAQVGETNRALDLLERTIKIPKGPDYGWLMLGDQWDSLRGNPRFEKIVASLAPKDADAAKKSIAVLPFENLSDDQGNAYFALGIQDDILVNLSRIRDLKVISRTSVMQYKSGSARNLREIGKELGVAHLLEGSVQRAGGKVRVHAQLIDARNDAHLWANTYDRDLADVFSIQSEIARTIAEQLQATLSPVEMAAMEKPATKDLAAHDLYIRAKTLISTPSPSGVDKDNLLQAAQLLDQAVARDPSFLPAYCQLAFAHSRLYQIGVDRNATRLASAQAAVEAALQLAPMDGEAHLAYASHLYLAYRDYERALAELAIARQTLPNHSGVFAMAGAIHRRQGRQEEGLRSWKQALDLDPRNLGLIAQLSNSYAWLRRYADQAAILERGLAINPKDIDTRLTRAAVDLNWRANTRPLHTTIQSILAENPGAAKSVADSWTGLALCERDASATERALAAFEQNAWGENAHFPHYVFGEGLLARMTNNNARAHAAFTAARAKQAKVVEAQPDYAPAIALLGLIDAGLGRKEDALREGRRAAELLPVAKDYHAGTEMIKYLAIIAAWTGEQDLALEQLTTASRLPAGLHYGELKLHPFWDPLRGDPRFEKIVASLAPKDAIDIADTGH